MVDAPVTEGRDGTPLASQRVRAAVCAAMGDRIPEGFRPECAPGAVVATGTDAAEADPSQNVDPLVIVSQVDADGTDHASMEHVRQSRLRLWQAQR